MNTAITGDSAKGKVWLGDADGVVSDSPPILEGDDILVSVERTDDDEVAIHGTLPDDNHALVSLYLTRAQAEFVAAAIMLERAR